MQLLSATIFPHDPAAFLISPLVPAYAAAAGGSRRGSPSAGSRKKRRRRRKTSGTRVLLFGRIRELALYRAEVLRDRGFSVQLPETKEEAIAIVRRGDFDIVVLTYTLDSDTVQEIAELAREYCTDCPLITISETGRTDRRIDPDETVIADQGPAALIAALRRVTRR